MDHADAQQQLSIVTVQGAKVLHRLVLLILDTYEGPVNAYPATDVEMSDARQAEEQQVTSGGDNSDQAASSYPSLIRATDGKGKDAKTKISTLVS